MSRRLVLLLCVTGAVAVGNIYLVAVLLAAGASLLAAGFAPNLPVLVAASALVGARRRPPR